MIRLLFPCLVVCLVACRHQVPLSVTEAAGPVSTDVLDVEAYGEAAWWLQNNLTEDFAVWMTVSQMDMARGWQLLKQVDTRTTFSNIAVSLSAGCILKVSYVQGERLTVSPGNMSTETKDSVSFQVNVRQLDPEMISYWPQCQDEEDRSALMISKTTFCSVNNGYMVYVPLARPTALVKGYSIPVALKPGGAEVAAALSEVIKACGGRHVAE